MKYLAFLLPIILVSCRTTLKIPPEALFFEVRTTACFGECPVYQMKIYGNRTAHFNGKAFTKKEGEWLKKVEKAQMDSLKKLVDKSDFFNLNDSYDNIGISDLPSFYLIVTDGKKTKTIHCRYDIPESLLDIYQYADRIRVSGEWKKSEK